VGLCWFCQTLLRHHLQRTGAANTPFNKRPQRDIVQGPHRGRPIGHMLIMHGFGYCFVRAWFVRDAEALATPLPALAARAPVLRSDGIESLSCCSNQCRMAHALRCPLAPHCILFGYSSGQEAFERVWWYLSIVFDGFQHCCLSGGYLIFMPIARHGTGDEWHGVYLRCLWPAIEMCGRVHVDVIGCVHALNNASVNIWIAK
jgi:hypothetical protein